MPANNIRIQRPNGFKTMSILGYVSEGLSLAIFPFILIFEISEGHILSAGFSLIYILLSTAAIVAIFMMVERKSNLALNLIRFYLWGSIPLVLLYSAVAAAESGDIASNIVGLIFNIVVGIPIALYWQQNSHAKYLRSFNH